jgi:hypothetical protein
MGNDARMECVRGLVSRKVRSGSTTIDWGLALAVCWTFRGRIRRPFADWRSQTPTCPARRKCAGGLLLHPLTGASGRPCSGAEGLARRDCDADLHVISAPSVLPATRCRAVYALGPVAVGAARLSLYGRIGVGVDLNYAEPQS